MFMKGFRWAFLLLAAFAGGASDLAGGEGSHLPAVAPVSPSYLILAPASGASHLAPTGTPRYAYGWFGVPPRKTNWTRHFGYCRNYTQWKVK
jgi:hypothetical protein